TIDTPLDTSTSTPPTDPGTTTPPTTSYPATSTTTSGAVPPELLAGITAHASDMLAVPSNDLDITRAEAVEWLDGSWGCPQPGQVYTQSLVRGYWVEIQIGDLALDYRTDTEGAFRLCGVDGIAPPSLLPPAGGEQTETTGFVVIGGDSK
ncbi:MAG: hypothetical protein ACRDWH_08210, partial [Acidimicrobiia bacterium]